MWNNFKNTVRKEKNGVSFPLYSITLETADEILVVPMFTHKTAKNTFGNTDKKNFKKPESRDKTFTEYVCLNWKSQIKK